MELGIGFVVLVCGHLRWVGGEGELGVEWWIPIVDRQWIFER